MCCRNKQYIFLYQSMVSECLKNSSVCFLVVYVGDIALMRSDHDDPKQIAFARCARENKRRYFDPIRARL